MDTVALGELIALLAIGLITPGPNALTCFAHSGMFGPKANVKLIAGMVIGFVTVELTVGLLVDAVSDSATAMTVLHWIGMAFLGAMVIAMFRFDPASVVVRKTSRACSVSRSASACSLSTARNGPLSSS